MSEGHQSAVHWLQGPGGGEGAPGPVLAEGLLAGPAQAPSGSSPWHLMWDLETKMWSFGRQILPSGDREG